MSQCNKHLCHHNKKYQYRDIMNMYHDHTTYINKHEKVERTDVNTSTELF